MGRDRHRLFVLKCPRGLLSLLERRVPTKEQRRSPGMARRASRLAARCVPLKRLICPSLSLSQLTKAKALIMTLKAPLTILRSQLGDDLFSQSIRLAFACLLLGIVATLPAAAQPTWVESTASRSQVSLQWTKPSFEGGRF